MINKASKYNIQNYHDFGICFPIKVLTDKELIYFQNNYREFENFYNGAPPKNTTKQLHLFFDWAYTLATHPAVLDQVEKILGENILIHSSSIFCKNPKDLNFVTWHQDGYYNDLDKPEYVSAWVALSNSTPENGCLRVIPGTHI